MTNGKKKTVIIGGGAAGPKVAAKLRRLDKDMIIDLYTDENVISYSACGLPYYVEGLITSIKKLIVRTPSEFRKQDVNINLLSRCVKIYPEEKKVDILNIKQNQLVTVNYDYLVIATGARPYIPNIKNINIKNVYYLRTLKDGYLIREKMLKSNTVTMIGGGYIGIELLEAFIKNNLKVNIIERNKNIMNLLDEELASLVTEHILNQDGDRINIYTQDTVIEFIEDDEKIKVVTSQGKVLYSDFVVICTGVIPNSELFAEAGGILGYKNTIKVDEFMKTSLRDVYSAGDCTENFNIITRKSSWNPLGSIANKEGRVVAFNICNYGEEFPGVLASTVTRYFDLIISTVGLSEKEAKSYGFRTVSVVVTKKDRAGYMPNVKNITIKLIANKNTRKILGAQAIGCGDAHKRINTVATALQSGMTISNFLHLDLPYAPPFSPSIDPLLTAAQIINEEINRDYYSV